MPRCLTTIDKRHIVTQYIGSAGLICQKRKQCNRSGGLPESLGLGEAPRMSLAMGEVPLGLGPLEGDDPLGVGEEPLGGLLPLGWVLAVGRVEVTVASSAEGSGTATQAKHSSGYFSKAASCCLVMEDITQG